MSPFERAVAGLVLGGETFVKRIREWALKRKGGVPEEQPSLKGLARSARPSSETVEREVQRVFPGVGCARKKRLKMYALRVYGGQRPTEIARRHGRTHGAVCLACRDLTAEARRSAAFAQALARLGANLGDRN